MDYLRFGNGSEPLVILPGLSVQSVMLVADAVVKAYAPLANDFAIYLLDQRRDLPDPYTVSDLARDACEALRVLGLDRVCVFGASMGGMMGLELAISYPDLIRKLALGSTTARILDKERQLFEGWAELAERGDAAALYLAFGEAVYPPGVLAQLREQLFEAAKTVTDEDLRRFAILARGIETFDVTERLEKIACPVLAIGVEDDRVLDARGMQEIADRLAGKPGFEFHLYDGYGHAAFDTAPDYKDRLLRFFTLG